MRVLMSQTVIKFTDCLNLTSMSTYSVMIISLKNSGKFRKQHLKTSKHVKTLDI